MKQFKDYSPQQWAHACRVAAKVAEEYNEIKFGDNPALKEAMEYLAGRFDKAQRSERSDAMILIVPRQ